jgi:hypothetical protein
VGRVVAGTGLVVLGGLGGLGGEAGGLVLGGRPGYVRTGLGDVVFVLGAGDGHGHSQW